MPENPEKKRMIKLTVRARSHDQYHGKSLADALLELFKGAGIGGATVMQGVKGYGRRGAANFEVLGLSVNLPVTIETVADHEKLDPLLPRVKELVGSNGLVTIEEVDVL